MTPRTRQAKLDALQPRIRRCVRCRLCKSRMRAVPGEGPAPAHVMLIGEAPGAREDIEGRPFLGRAGGFLNAALAAASLSRERLYITNSVKCRPPDNRSPLQDELMICREAWLNRQIELVNPRLVVLLGASPVRQIFGRSERVADLHGRTRIHDGRSYFVTYHPASMRFPRIQKTVIADLRALKRRLSKPFPQRR